MASPTFDIRRPLDGGPRRGSARAARLARLAVAGLGLLVGLLVASARPARAEDDDAAIRAKLKEQIEKILRLMKENEDALLRVSTGLSGTPKKPEIELPPSSSEGKPPPEGGKEDAPPAEDEEAQRAEIVRRIKALLEGQREVSREIPAELKELIRLIPQTESQSPSEQPPPPGQPPRPESQEARDARKQLEEQQRKEEEAAIQAGKEPKSSRDPKDRTSLDPDDPEGGASPSTVVSWLAGLPPEIRDAFANGDFGSVPAPYRDLIRRYVTWLNRQSTAGERR
jgi:hypothetical protein